MPITKISSTKEIVVYDPYKGNRQEMVRFIHLSGKVTIAQIEDHLREKFGHAKIHSVDTIKEFLSDLCEIGALRKDGNHYIPEKRVVI